MKHYFDVALGPKGPVAQASVTVWNGGTNQTVLASIFSDNGITAKANPFPSDALGNFDFYTADGSYDLTFSSGNIQFKLQTDVQIGPGVTGTLPGTVGFTGNVSVNGSLTTAIENNIIWVGPGIGQFSTFAAAVTAAGTINKTTINIASNYAGACPALTLFSTNPNISVQDFSGKCNPTVPSGGYNGITFNFSDGNVQAGERRGQQYSTLGTNAAGVAAYWIAAPTNFTVGSVSTLDGISAELDFFGTLSGNVGHASTAEHSVTIASTGGTLTDAQALNAYVNISGTSALTTARGVWARGCLTITGTAPVSCYGIQADDQGNKGSSRNFALYGIGRNLIGYSATTAGAAIFFEDSANTPHQTFVVDSTGLFNVQSPTATGTALEDNLGNIQALFNGSGVQFRTNPPYPFVAGGLDLGKTANPWGNLWLGTAATNNFKLQPGTTTGARVITITDPVSPTTVGLPLVIATGTSTLTANATLASVTSQAAITSAATGAATTDAIEWSYASAPGAGDSLCILSPYVTANNVNFVRSNPTAAAQNVSAIVVNWRVIR